MTTLSRRFNIYGRVQGVGFRASTQRKATALGLSGWVRNDEQGHVEVLACGSSDQLNALAEWLNTGPSAAEVKRVEPADATGNPLPAEGFIVR